MRGVPSAQPLLTFAAAWVVMLALMLVVDLFSRSEMQSPIYEILLLTLIAVTTLIGVRLLLYPTLPLGDFSWLGNTLRAIFNFTEGVRPELLLILAGGLLWWRVVNMTSRELGFWSIGVSFRLAILLLLVGGGLLATLGAAGTSAALLCLWLFFRQRPGRPCPGADGRKGDGTGAAEQRGRCPALVAAGAAAGGDGAGAGGERGRVAAADAATGARGAGLV